MSCMFARYFVELPIDSTVVEQALTRSPESWLPGIADGANDRGRRLLAEVGFGEDVRVHKAVEIKFGDPLRIPAKTILPLTWTAAGTPGLFPTLDADLEIAPLGSRHTQLSMSARYVPPLGAFGKAVDRAVLHRVAEATLKDFLDRVAEALLSGTTDRNPVASYDLLA